MKTKKKLITLTNGSSLSIIDRLIENGDNFSVIQTGYSTIIEKENKRYFCSDISATGGKKKILMYRQKIISEIKKNEINFDAIPNNKIRFYELGSVLKTCEGKTIYNIDISSAYPTCLKNLGFISDNLYNELMTENKIIRLKSIGSIATRKLVTNFINGVAQTPEIKENKYYRDIFFLLCYEIGELMYEINKNINSFMFFWFDGIYFSDLKEKEIIEKIIINKGYQSKFEVLNNFTVKNDDNSDLIKIEYLKENKKKLFNLPKNLKINKF